MDVVGNTEIKSFEVTEVSQKYGCGINFERNEH